MEYHKINETLVLCLLFHVVLFLQFLYNIVIHISLLEWDMQQLSIPYGLETIHDYIYYFEYTVTLVFY